MFDIGPYPGMQEALIQSEAELILYGARANVGKSWGTLMLAAAWVARQYKGNLIFFRRRTQDLSLQGSIVSSARTIFRRDPRCNIREQPLNDFRWMFKAGELSLSFRSLPDAGDEEKFQGPGFDLIVFDEATHFETDQWLYFFTRNRAPKSSPVKPKIVLSLNPIPYGPLHELAAPFLDDEIEWTDHFGEQHVGGLADPRLSGEIKWVARAPEGHESFWIIGNTRDEVCKQMPKAKLDPVKYTLISGGEDDNPSADWPDYIKRLKMGGRPWVVRSLLHSDWKAAPSEPGKIWDTPQACFFKRGDADFEELLAIRQPMRWFGAWDFGRVAHGLFYAGGVLQPGAPPVLWFLVAIGWTQSNAKEAAADRVRVVGDLIRALDLDISSETDFSDPSGEAKDSGEGWAATLREHGVPLVPIALMDDAEQKTWWSWNSHEGFQRRIELVQRWMDGGRLRVDRSLTPLAASLRGWKYDLPKNQVDPGEVNTRILRPTKGKLSHPGDAITYLTAGVQVILGQEGQPDEIPDLQTHEEAMQRAALLSPRRNRQRDIFMGVR